MLEQGGASRTLSIVYELTKTMIGIVIALLLIHLFVGTIFVVDGASMEPNFHTGQVVWVNKLAYLASTPSRGDTVVLRFPGDPVHSRYIKRIIGVPNDTVDVKNGKILINNQPLLESYLPADTVTTAERFSHIVLGPRDYFLVGDNRLNSSDSRVWGQARKEDLIGRARLVIFPPSQFGYVANVFYN